MDEIGMIDFIARVNCNVLRWKLIPRLADDFENEGGFNERLYRVRASKRNRK